MHPAHRAFRNWLLRRREAVVGQVWIRVGRRFELRHVQDAAAAPARLHTCRDSRAAREIALWTDDGRYRPLKSAPNLRRGWRLAGLDFGQLVRALDWFYPAALAHWHRARQGRLEVTSYRACAGRQSGMYRITTKLTDEQVRRLAACCCGSRECLKLPQWSVNGQIGLGLAKSAGGGRDRLEIPCPEPCSLLLSFARKVVRLEQEEPIEMEWTRSDLELIGAVVRATVEGEQTPCREGDFEDPRHRWRLGYFLRKHEWRLPKRRAAEEGQE